MSKSIAIILILLGLLGCESPSKKSTIYFFIPMDYTGWVNIIPNSKNGVEQSYTFKDGYVYMITGDPSHFKINGSLFPDGKYNMCYVYYNIDSTVNLSWSDYPIQNIFFEKMKGLQTDKEKIKSFTFYVSKKKLNVNETSEETLPKNTLYE